MMMTCWELGMKGYQVWITIVSIDDLKEALLMAGYVIIKKGE